MLCLLGRDSPRCCDEPRSALNPQPFLCRRQLDRKGRADTGFTLKANGPALQFDELPGQGKAETGAVVAARERAVNLTERLEDFGRVLRVDTDAGVRDADADYPRYASPQQ